MDNGTSLSQRESALLAAWERRRQRSISSEELRRLLGADAARKTVRQLIRKGLLERARRGVYLIHPFRTLARRQATSPIIVASTFLAGQPHYFGGLWALSLHHLSQQAYVSQLDAFVLRHKQSRVLDSSRVVFHAVRAIAFEYGIQNVEIEQTPICVSDAERTLLDVLDYPHIAGGLTVALQLIAPALERVNHERLISHALHGSRMSTCQRLGVLLERNRVDSVLLERLRQRTGRSRTLRAMDRSAPRTGRVNRRWNVIENDLAVVSSGAQSIRQ